MTNTKKKSLKKVVIIILIVLLLLGIISLIYLSTGHYQAQDRAIYILDNADNLQITENLFILSPEEESDTAIIFYPGAKVEASAYLPLLEKITKQIGVVSILVEMPFNMAIFDTNAATKIIENMVEIENFYIAGHSLGSSMASTYAQENSEFISGLIVMGGFVYGDYPPENSLTIYGTFNSEIENHIDYSENIVVIEGGNHAQFGDYGKQDGDPDATITAEEQENITVQAIKEFIASVE